MFDTLLKSKFYTKCKTALKQSKSRILIVKRKRNAMLKFLRNDVSDLLKNGLDSNAYGRAEGLWNELNLSSCYDFVENFCVHISTHLQDMNKRSECPEDCREAVSSLIFAAARFADLPELRELRAVFTERYGNSIDLYANKEFVNKLKATPPTDDVKLQLMRDIAEEYGIEWNSKALEQKLHNNKVVSVPGPPALVNSHENEKIKEEESRFAQKTDINVLNKHKHDDQRGRGTDSPKKEGAERINRKQQQKQDNNPPNARLVTTSGREVEGVQAFHRGKELTGNGIHLPVRSRECVVAEGKIQDEPQTDADRPFYYKAFRQPYTKPTTSNVVNSSTSTALTGIGHEVALAEHAKEPGHHIDRENHLPQGEPNGSDKVKPVPKSVRRRFLKLQPVPDEDEKQSKVVPDHEPKDKEEKKPDSLLVHYSKKSSSDGRKLESAMYHTPQQAAAADSLTSRRRMDKKGKDVPTPRTASFPDEQSSAETPRKELGKSASFQAENCHIHPKLPDYEDFVARLAALRDNLE